MHDQLVIEFKRELQKIAHANSCGIEQAFIQWYLDTYFEKEARKQVTDGKHDGGIDAIARYRKKYFVIQSEFSHDIFRKKSRVSPLSLKKISQFDQLPGIFRDQKHFPKWLTSVESSLRSKYEEVADAIRSNPNSVIWEFITLHDRSPAGAARLENLDSDNFYYFRDNLRLFELSLLAATPPSAPLELTFSEHFIVDDRKKTIRSYVLQANLKDLVDYLDEDPYFRLLAQNVRSKIPKSDINDNIRATFVKKPDEFWYSHNGITIICDQANIRGNTIVLKRPSVINGAQTLHSLQGVAQRDPHATVLVRVMEIYSGEGNPEIVRFINDIIFRTNQQNKMNKYNLRANDKIQVKLAKDFVKHKVFYERRIGEWDLNKRVLKNDGYEQLKVPQMAQYLVSCRPDLGGVVVAKKSKEALFSEPIYDKLFNVSFDEAFLKYCLMRYCQLIFKQFRGRKNKGKRFLLSTVFSIIWTSLARSSNLKRWMQLNSAIVGGFRERDDAGLSTDIRDVYRECMDMFRGAQTKDPDFELRSFINDKKWNDLLIKKIVPHVSKNIQRHMSQMFP